MAKRLLTTQRIVNLASDPASGTAGEIYYNTVDNAFKYYNGSSWTSFSSISGNLPSGGSAGQILAKIDATNYNTEWIDNYTSQIKHEVKAGESINKGQAVYVSSANGTNMIVSKASNASESTSSKTMGLLAQNLSTNDIGFVITEGLLSGLDTSTATAGDPVWLGTSGNLIYGLANKPVAPDHLVFIGIVTRVQSQNGEIFIKVQNGFELQELHNVLITSVADKNILSYDNATSLWKNKSLLTAITEIDGASSGIDADLLDGQHGSYYSDWTNITNKPDPVITLAGDLTGSVTLTDLASGTLTATIAADSVALGTDTTGNYVASVSGTDGVSISGTGEGASVTIANNDKGSSQNIFKNVAVSGQSDIVADSNNDTLTFSEGTGITLTTNATTDTLTITNAGVISVNGSTGSISNVALTTGKLSQFASTTSSELLGVISDETGTGSLVFSSSPTFSGTVNAANLTLSGDLTVNGTTTTINSTTISVDDKNIELGSVTTPTDTTADGGGITLKGTTDKTFNWVDATDSWTSSEHLNLATGKAYYINGTSVLNATTLGSGITGSSLTSVGTIGTGVWQGSEISTTYTAAKVTSVNGSTGAVTGLATTAGKLSQFAATTSSELAGVISDETGSGALVFATSPTLTTPILGVASATSINKVAFTSPATSATLTLADGSTLATSGAFSITLTSTGATNVTLPTSGTLATTTQALQWDGGSTNLVAATGRTSLGATTVGSNVFTLVNPSAISYIKIAADNTVSAASASTVKTDLSLNNVENTALSTWAGSSNITTLGTISTGTWSATAIGVTKGGTGLTAGPTANGQLLIGSSTGSYTLSTITAGSNITITNASGSITIAAAAVLSPFLLGGM